MPYHVCDAIAGDLEEKGVECEYNNRRVAGLAHVLFLCVLPTQLQAVLDQITSSIANSDRRPLVYSFVYGVKAKKLVALLQYPQVIVARLGESAHGKQPWEGRYRNWDQTLSVKGCYESRETLDLTCPLFESGTVLRFLASHFIFTFLSSLNINCKLCTINRNCPTFFGPVRGGS